MSAYSGRVSNSSENGKTETAQKESLLSIYRRNSSSSRLEVEGEPPTLNKYSRKQFSLSRLSSLSSSSGREELGYNRDKGEGGSQILAVKRRGSLYLNHEGCDESTTFQLMNCGSYAKMDSSCYAESNRRQERICGFIPCLIALGAIIFIFIPLAKILGGLKSDLTVIHNEMTDIKKHVGIDTAESKSLAPLPKEYSDAIKSLVKEELDNFSSDKVGRTDFALETAGGRIVKIVDTENYGSTVGLFGLTLCEGTNGPRAMIQPSNAPGECWAFKGSKGTAIIKLLGRVRINAVSLEHIPNNISPTGRLDTAPKDFSIYGLEDLSKTKVPLGRFQYRVDSYPTQIFPIDKACHVPFEFVEFHVDSNHGSSEYTCVYRLRVHGTLDSL